MRSKLGVMVAAVAIPTAMLGAGCDPEDWEDWQDAVHGAKGGKDHPGGKGDHEDDKKAGCRFKSKLTPDQEVPPTESPATGRSKLEVRQGLEAIDFELDVEDITNFTVAHIHLGPRGINGPVVAFLAGPFGPAGGPVIAGGFQGTIRAENLVGPLQGHPLSELIAAMQTSGAYVNAHTSDGVDDPVGPAGDYPAGEIRGQIELVGKACKVDANGAPMPDGKGGDHH